MDKKKGHSRKNKKPRRNRGITDRRKYIVFQSCQIFVDVMSLFPPQLLRMEILHHMKPLHSQSF